MSEDVAIRIIGQDQGASQAFQRVGQAAGRAADQADGFNRVLDQVERNTREAATALDRMTQAQSRTEQAAARSRTAWAAYGASLTTVLGTLSDFARAAAEEEVTFRRLEQAVEAAGDSYADYAEAIDQAIARGEELAFADDQVADAIARITTTTGDTQAALDALGTAMDFARARGIDLSTAADLIGKALAGNTGTLARYGVVVREGADATEVLAAIQQRAAGQAEAYASTTQGQLDRLRNTWDNLTETIGAHTGPLQTVLALLPGLQAGYTLAGGVVGALVPKITALTAAMGPVGLAAAAGAAALALSKFIGSAEETEVSTRSLADSADDLADRLGQLANAGIGPETLGRLRDYAEAWMDAGRNANEAAAAIAVAQTEIGALMHEETQLLNELVIADDRRRAEIQARLQQIDAEIKANEELIAAKQRLIVSDKEYTQVFQALDTILSDSTRINYPQLVARLEELRRAHEEDRITAEEWGAGIVLLAQNVDSYGLSLDQIAPKQQQMAEDAAKAAEQIKALNELLAKFEPPTLPTDFAADVTHLFAGTTDQAKALQQEFRRLVEAGTPMEALIPIADQMADAVRREEIHLRATSEAMSRTVAAHRAGEQAMAQTAETAEETEARIAALTRSLGPQIEAAHGTNVAWQALDASQQELIDRLVQGQLAMLGYAQALGVAGTAAQALAAIDLGPRGADKALGLAAGMQSAATGMDAVLGLFKTIDQLQSRGRDAAEIAKDLVGEPGVYATVDKLLEEGRISLTRYTMAVEAGYRIQERQAEIEADLNVIRAKQLPLLDEAQEQYAKLIDQISHMDATQQMVTLGFMDSTEAMKAQQAVMLAAQAAYGELGEAGEETAERIIQGAVAADPVLKAMLEDLGLISVGADGTVTVNFPEGEGINELLEQTNQNLQDLAIAIDLIDGKPDLQITVEYLENEARKKIDDTKQKMDNLDGTTATVSVYANTSPFWSSVRALDGSYVGTVYVGVEAIRQLGGFQPYATGGTVPYEAQVPIPRAALGRTLSGGSLAMVGEDGPEIVHLPAGAQVTNAVATRSRLRSVQRTAGDVVITGPVYVVSNTPQEFAREMAKYRRSEARR